MPDHRPLLSPARGRGRTPEHHLPGWPTYGPDAGLGPCRGLLVFQSGQVECHPRRLRKVAALETRNTLSTGLRRSHRDFGFMRQPGANFRSNEV